jgi:hypothetical protein
LMSWLGLLQALLRSCSAAAMLALAFVDLIHLTNVWIASTVYSRAAAFTCSHSLGLPRGLPEMPGGNGLPRGFSLRFC